MKMFRMMILASAALVAASFTTFAAELPNGVVAQVQISGGGFMPPSMARSTFFNVDTNGVITRVDYSVSGNTTKVIAKLNNHQLSSVETLVSSITSGKLFDVNPNSPAGADFPYMSYRIHNRFGTIVIAERRGDAHTYALREQPAIQLKNILDRITKAN